MSEIQSVDVLMGNMARRNILLDTTILAIKMTTFSTLTLINVENNDFF